MTEIDMTNTNLRGLRAAQVLELTRAEFMLAASMFTNPHPTSVLSSADFIGFSRPPVQRAMEDFEGMGWVVRRPGGWQCTPEGVSGFLMLQSELRDISTGASRRFSTAFLERVERWNAGRPHRKWGTPYQIVI